MRWNQRKRRTVLIVISMVCLATGAAMLYAPSAAGTAHPMRMPAILLLLGLMLLPGATFAARRLERRLRQRVLVRATAPSSGGRG